MLIYCYYSIYRMLSFVCFRVAKNLVVFGYYIRYLKECVLLYISMGIINKVFHYEENELPVIKCKDDIWFRGKTIAEILKYANQRKAIRDYIDPEDRARFDELHGRKESVPLTNNEKNTIYINESGLYSLILCCQLESTLVFKRWVTKEVLPSIRKIGKYSYDDMDHKYNNRPTFKSESELELYIQVVSFLKKRYPNSIFTATLDENQDTINKRIESHKIGYLRGSPDLIINNLHKYYTGLATEFKSPNGKGILSYDQSKMLQQDENNCFKTQLIEQLIEYFRDVRIKCLHCSRKFISSQSIKNRFCKTT